MEPRSLVYPGGGPSLPDGVVASCERLAVRYREGIGFNYRLIAFAGRERPAVGVYRFRQRFVSQPRSVESGFDRDEKSEDDDRIVIRFYEAEGIRPWRVLDWARRSDKPARRV